MTKANDLAFPAYNKNGSYCLGITKREYFAAMALQGIVGGKKAPAWYERDLSTEWQDIMAKDAVLLADALINQLNKE